MLLKILIGLVIGLLLGIPELKNTLIPRFKTEVWPKVKEKFNK